MKRQILSLLLGAVALGGVAQGVCVYRNDGRFDMLPLGDGVSLTHTLSGAAPSVGDGGWSAPLSAIDSLTVRVTDIPTFRFTFPEHPDLDWVTSKTDYIPALLDIEGGGLFDDMEGLELSVRGRGNSTWGMAKRPMRLKFGKKTSLCGMTKAKNYVLLADYIDPSLMRNAAAHWLARELGVDYACHTTPCHVYVNGRYAGAYNLAEKIGINGASVDIDETRGVLIEMSNEFDEPYEFFSARNKLPVMVKDPDLGELCAEHPELGTPEELLARWRDDFNAAERAAAQGQGEDWYDMESFARYLLVCDITLNDEIGHPKSLYMVKEGLGRDHRYRFGPTWDFDASFDIVARRSGELEMKDPEGQLWMNALFGDLVDTPGFEARYRGLFEEFERDIYPRMVEWLRGYAALIEPSALLDGQRWPDYDDLGWTCHVSAYDRAQHVGTLLDWLQRRVEHMHQQLCD